MSVLHHKEVLERLEGDQELYEQILEIFVEDFPQQLRQLTDGIRDKDRDVLQRVSHSLKSAAANIGAVELSQMLQRWESAARADSLDIFAQEEELLRSRGAEVCNAAQALREKYRSGQNGV